MQTFIFGLFVLLQTTQATAYKLQVGGEMGVSDEGGYPPSLNRRQHAAPLEVYNKFNLYIIINKITGISNNITCTYI
jgi:hypothetical protein